MWSIVTGVSPVTLFSLPKSAFCFSEIAPAGALRLVEALPVGVSFLIVDSLTSTPVSCTLG